MGQWGIPVALLQGQEVAMYILAGSIGVSLMLGSLAWSIGMLVNKIRGHGGRTSLKASPAPQDTSSAKALEVYKELAKEKLEVIKTALAMGYSDAEIAQLDARLENLIGKDKLVELLKGGSAESIASADLVDTQLEREIERLRQLRGKT